MKTRGRTHDPREAEVIANATAYVVCGFRGRAVFEKERYTELAAARSAAVEMATRLRKSVAIYALMPGPAMERQAHLENAEPR